MTTIKDTISRTLLYALALLLGGGLLVTLLTSCAPGLSQRAPEDLEAFAVARSIAFSERELAYVDTDATAKPLILFVHGTPGSWLAFERYLRDPRLRDRARMIAVDRLGFGGSSSGDVAPDFADQSASIVALLHKKAETAGGAQKAVLVGHSLGASIVLRIATDHPDRVAGVLAISGGIDPALAAPRWYHRLADTWPIKHLIPEGLHRANEEMMVLKPMLDAQSGGLQRLSMPVEVIQGGEDPLVDEENADYAERMIPNVRVHRFPDSGHFIVWEQPDFVVERILSLLDTAGTERIDTPGTKAEHVGQTSHAR